MRNAKTTGGTYDSVVRVTINDAVKSISQFFFGASRLVSGADLFRLAGSPKTLSRTGPGYNATPSSKPWSLYSQGFEATAISEFGNHIRFDGASRILSSVTVDMVTWAYFSKHNAPGTPNTGGWTHPVTLNIYAVGANNTPGAKLGSVTQNFFIPWRPENDPSCGGDGLMWRGPDGCHHGMVVPFAFDFSPALTVPDEIIFGIAYNTQSSGYQPISAAGPYNDLNVGFNIEAALAGTNLSAPTAYVCSAFDHGYSDNGAGGINVYRLDDGGEYPNIAIQFSSDIQNTDDPVTVADGDAFIATY